MEIRMPQPVKGIIRKLNDCGYEAYIVGGCVRDSLFGIEPHDWDICTSALPEQIMDVFHDKGIVTIGLKHGTVSVVYNHELYEITTYRIDGEYGDCRHPDNVEFTTDLTLDLSRRDFTINAMAYNPKVGLIDVFGGKSDLDNNVLKCVGNPKERFTEDALRIMRAIRFAAIYNLEIEKETLSSMHECSGLMTNVSYERISSEIKKMMIADRVYLANTLDKTWECLMPIFKEATSANKDEMCKRIKRCNGSPVVKLSLLFDFDKNTQRNAMSRMKFSNVEINDVVAIRNMGRHILDNLIEVRDMYISEQKYFCKKMLHDANFVTCINAIDYAFAYLTTEDYDYYVLVYLSNFFNDVYRSGECHQLSMLEINGSEVVKFGFVGKEIGDVLNTLLEMVMQGTLPNSNELLLAELPLLRKGALNMNVNNELEIFMEDVVNAGYTGEHADIMYSFINDMVNSGYYENSREFLLDKLKTLELKDVNK